MVKRIPYFNRTLDGNGMEGWMHWANRIMDNWFIPVFLLVMYSATLYVLSKSDYKMGGVILYTSISFFIITMIAQTFATFNQMILFLFGIGIIVGVVVSFVENAMR